MSPEWPYDVGGSGDFADIEVQYEGTISIVRAMSSAGKEWLEEHIPDDATFAFGGVVVEHRFIDDIVNGILNDGLRILGG